jgi:hypothetical protein
MIVAQNELEGCFVYVVCVCCVVNLYGYVVNLYALCSM